MVLHERVWMHAFLAVAIIQALVMSLRPGHYNRLRHWFVLCNRLMRLASNVMTAALLTPAIARQQASAWLRNSSGFLGSSSSTDGIDVPAMCKALLATPSVYMMHAHFVLSFRLVVVMQFVSFSAVMYTEAYRVCTVEPYHVAAAASAVPTCQVVSWLAHAGGQLFDGQFLMYGVDTSNDGPSLCRSVEGAILLLSAWVNLWIIVVLPCTAIYSLERALKLKFLAGAGMNISAATTASANGSGHVDGVPAIAAQQTDGQHGMEPHARGPTLQPQGRLARHAARQALNAGSVRQQQAAHLEAVLGDIAPLPLHEALPQGWKWLIAVPVALLASWHVCEAVFAFALHGRQFVCDASGVLSLS